MVPKRDLQVGYVGGLILNNPAMEVYTSSDLEQKREAVKKLEAAVHRAAVSVSGPTLTE